MNYFEEKLNKKKIKDLRILSNFVEIYCKNKHKNGFKNIFEFKGMNFNDFVKKEIKLCEDCDKLLKHGIVKLLLCPYNPKPKCKNCLTHCYAPWYRENIKKVMKFSGIYLIKHGRLDLLFY